MSNAILRMRKAVGSFIVDGSFEDYSIEASLTSGKWSKVLIGGAGSCAVVSTGTPTIFDGSDYLKMISGAAGEHIECQQELAVISGLAGKEVTFAGWAWSKTPGSYAYIDTDAGRLATGATAPGLTEWEEIFVTGTIPSGVTQVIVGIGWDPGLNSKSAYYDCFSIVAGETRIGVELEEGYIFPHQLPEDYLVAEGMTVDGEPYYNDNGVVIPYIRLDFEGIPEAQYLKLRNFFRYVCFGPTTEAEFVDLDGTIYTCRLAKDSFGNPPEIGPGLYSCSIILRVNDSLGIE